MSEPIRRRDGKFAGSVGSGKAQVPTAAKTRPAVPEGVTSTPDLSLTVDRYRGLMSRAQVPEWVGEAPPTFMAAGATAGRDAAFSVDFTSEMQDRLYREDRTRPVEVRTETADLFLRAEMTSRTEGAPGDWKAVYVYPAYRQADGSVIATHVRKDTFTASYMNGVVDADGHFHADPSAFGRVLNSQVGEPGCPLYGALAADVDDFKHSLVVDRDSHAVRSLRVQVTCDPVDVDE